MIQLVLMAVVVLDMKRFKKGTFFLIDNLGLRASFFKAISFFCMLPVTYK